MFKFSLVLDGKERTSFSIDEKTGEIYTTKRRKNAKIPGEQSVNENANEKMPPKRSVKKKSNRKKPTERSVEQNSN